MQVTDDTSIMALARVDNKYLASEELPTNSDLIVTVAKIVQEEILNPKNNKSSVKTVVYFKEDGIKPSVFNKTNMTSLHRSTHAETVGEAVGHKIALYCNPSVRFGGKTVSGIRVSNYDPASDEYKKDSKERDAQYGRATPIMCERCGKEIHGAAGHSGIEIAEIAKKNVGKALCADCMRAVAKEQKEKESR